MLPLNPSSWGPSTHGVPVVIDEVKAFGPIVAMDVETDEADNFVGGAVYDGTGNVHYFTDREQFKASLVGKKIVGFNVKGDLNWIRGWGLDIQPDAIEADPMIMSYVENSNKESHGLKEVSKQVLGWNWPSYRDMVGIRKDKKTLDKQAVEKVAEYCGMDTLATWRLYEHYNKSFNSSQLKLYRDIELPLYRMLWGMERRGINIDRALLQTLDGEFGCEVKRLEQELRTFESTWNPNSVVQTLDVLLRNSINVKGTAKEDLAPFKGNKLVDTLLAYRKIKKLHSTYVVSLNERASGTIHTTFNQVSYKNEGNLLKGIRTGRLSSNNPNLQNIPAKKKDGDYASKLRKLFVPTPGRVFVDVDYSQIEYRLLAHFSQEPHLVKGFHEGKDVHEVTGKLLGCDRKVGKTLNFASIYGAQAGKISNTAGITEAQAEVFLSEYWKALPGVQNWITRTKLLAKARGGVQTMAGRWIPLPDLNSRNKWKRAHAERAAINYIIQGSAADIIKVAMLELKKQGFDPLIQVHDELIFECDQADVARVLPAVKSVMENVVKLTVPILVDAHSGLNWDEAKG